SRNTAGCYSIRINLQKIWPQDFANGEKPPYSTSYNRIQNSNRVQMRHSVRTSRNCQNAAEIDAQSHAIKQNSANFQRYQAQFDRKTGSATQHALGIAFISRTFVKQKVNY